MHYNNLLHCFLWWLYVVQLKPGVFICFRKSRGTCNVTKMWVDKYTCISWTYSCRKYFLPWFFWRMLTDHKSDTLTSHCRRISKRFACVPCMHVRWADTHGLKVHLHSHLHTHTDTHIILKKMIHTHTSRMHTSHSSYSFGSCAKREMCDGTPSINTVVYSPGLQHSFKLLIDSHETLTTVRKHTQCMLRTTNLREDSRKSHILFKMASL